MTLAISHAKEMLWQLADITQFSFYYTTGKKHGLTCSDKIDLNLPGKRVRFIPRVCSYDVGVETMWVMLHIMGSLGLFITVNHKHSTANLVVLDRAELGELGEVLQGGVQEASDQLLTVPKAIKAIYQLNCDTEKWTRLDALNSVDQRLGGVSDKDSRAGNSA